MIFPADNLPTSSKAWGREITKQLSNVIDSSLSDQINNAARDNQLNSSIIAAEAIARNAQATADAVTAIVNNIYTDGTTSLDGAIMAPGTLSASSITTGVLDAQQVNVINLSADNITTGTLSGDYITGGTISGASLQTSGLRHVEISGTSAKFFGDDGNQTSDIYASGNSGEGMLTITNGGYVAGGVASIDLYNQGMTLAATAAEVLIGDNGNGGVRFNAYVNVSSGGINVDGSGTFTAGWQTVGGTQIASGVVASANSGGNAAGFSRIGSTGSLVTFYNGTTTNVGTISVTASATAYNTSSDYRLKENVIPITDGLSRLAMLKPSKFNFKIEPDKIVDGFIAHEVTPVVPEAVLGEKDALHEDGTPDYQAIDQSKLVPLLVAAVQELAEKVRILEGN